MGVFDYFKDIIGQIGPDKFRNNTLRQIASQIQPYNPNSPIGFQIGPNDITSAAYRTPNFNPNLPQRPPSPLAPVGPQIGQGDAMEPPTETPMQNWGMTVYDDPSLQAGSQMVAPVAPEVLPNVLDTTGGQNTQAALLQNTGETSYVVGDPSTPTPVVPLDARTPNAYGANRTALTDRALNRTLADTPAALAMLRDRRNDELPVPTAEERRATAQQMGTTVQPVPLATVTPPKGQALRYRGQTVGVANKAGTSVLVDQYGSTVANLRDLENVLDGKRVYTVGNDVLNEEGFKVADRETARNDRDFRFTDELTRIRTERRAAQAAGNTRRVLELDVEESRARQKWFEDRPEDKTRSFGETLKNIGMGLLQGYAKTGNIWGALGGGVVSGVATGIRPEIGQKWMDSMFRLPGVEAKVAQSQGRLDAFNKQEADNRKAMTEELKLRTEVSEGYRKQLEDNQMYRQIFINGDGYATPDQIKAIDDAVGWSTGLIPYLPKASGMQQSKLPNGQLAYITPLGNAVLASVRTDKGVEPIQYQSEAEMPVTINGAPFTLNSKDAAKLVGDLAQKNLDIAMREATENSRRDLALLRYGALGDVQRNKALQKLTTLEFKDKKAATAITDALKEHKRLTDEIASRLRITDTQGNVLVELREEDLGGSELTYVRTLKTKLAALDAQINQLALAQAESKALMEQINKDNPVVLSPASATPVQLPRINVGVAPNQPTVPASKVDSLIRK